MFGDVIFLYFYYYPFFSCSLEVAMNAGNHCFVSDYHLSAQPICRQPAQVCLAKYQQTLSIEISSAHGMVWRLLTEQQEILLL